MVFIGYFVGFVGLQEEYLCYVFVGVDFCWQVGGIGEFEGYMVFLFWFQWSDVDDDVVMCVGVFVQVDGQDVVWDVEVFDGVCQGEGVWWDDVDVVVDVDEVFFVEVFWIDYC